MLPSLDIPNLSPAALRALADFLSRLSTEIQRHAENAEASDQIAQLSRARFDRARASFNHTGAMVLAYIDAGTPINAALELVMAASGLDHEQVRFAYSLAQKERRHHREIVITWLKRQGWSDAKIGEAVGLHEKSVTRLRNER